MSIGSLFDIKRNLNDLRVIEIAIWRLVSDNPRDFRVLIDRHKELSTLLNELYNELTSIWRENELFEHMKTPEGEAITQLLRKLRTNLIDQYELLLKVKKKLENAGNKKMLSIEEIKEIRDILDGNKNGKNESETSQNIKLIEKELQTLIEPMIKKAELVMSN